MSDQDSATNNSAHIVDQSKTININPSHINNHTTSSLYPHSDKPSSTSITPSASTHHQHQHEREQDQLSQQSGSNRIRDRSTNNNDITVQLSSLVSSPSSSLNQIEQIKSKLNIYQHQLLSTLFPHENNNQQQQQQQPILNPIELIKIITQLQEQCEQMVKSEINLQFLIQHHDVQLKQQQIDLQKLMDQSQQKLTQQATMNQQQNKLDQAQIKFERQQQLFELECQRREFELTKRESTLNQQHSQLYENESKHNEQITIEEQSSISIISDPSTSISQHTSIISNIDNQSDAQNITNELLLQLVQDYQAMKYLVDQSTTTQQLFQQHYSDLNQKINDVEEIQYKVNKIDQIESKLNEFQESSTGILSTQVSQFDQRLISLETNYQQQFRQQAMLIQYQQRQYQQQRQQQITSILEQNSRSKLIGNKLIAFQFVDTADLQCSCAHWDLQNDTLHLALYTFLIDGAHSTILKPLKSTIQTRKLFISTKSVLNGEWFQVQGDGAVADINTIKLAHLVKSGDNIYPYSDYSCKSCEWCKADDDKITRRFLIRIKWE